MTDDTKATQEEPVEINDTEDNIIQFYIDSNFIANALTAQAQIQGIIEGHEFLSALLVEDLPDDLGWSVTCLIEKNLLN